MGLKTLNGGQFQLKKSWRHGFKADYLIRLSELPKKKSQEVGPGVESVPRMRCLRCPTTTEGKRVLQRSVDEGEGRAAGVSGFDEG